MFFDKLDDREKSLYFFKPIIKALQDAGGQLERSELKDIICENDEHLAEYDQIIVKSSNTGERYKPFYFKFNFAINKLKIAKILTYEKNNPLLTLTTKGANINLKNFDVEKEVENKAWRYWEKETDKEKKNISRNTRTGRKPENIDSEESPETDENSTENASDVLDDFKIQLQSAIANMPPKKFESFSRALLNKMGVKFTDAEVQVSRDGWIDGCGYHTDESSFRTSRVFIQCQRYESGPITPVEIKQFLGEMTTKKADYGIFITNITFSEKAKKLARDGTPITLIDGNELINLVIKYQVYITPVTTYVLDDFYTNDEQ